MRVNPISAVLNALRATLRELESMPESERLRHEKSTVLHRIAELERLSGSSDQPAPELRP